MRPILVAAAGMALLALPARAAIPTEVQQPGTQPLEVASLESANKCDNCHGGYAATVEPARNWRGGAMSQAGRDPLFWATMAVAEQDFPGAGDFCLRCHSPDGWLSGRSSPTDGSGLAASDDEGVSCDLCHSLTDPDGGEWVGVQNSPFLAHDDATPPVGYFGSGMYVLWGGQEHLGPFDDANPPHSKLTSKFHRDARLCGTCHDVSNPVVGDLAHNHGAQPTADPVVASGVPGSPVAGKAAFNNFPFQYGVVERTFSEHQASGLAGLALSSYATLPAELRSGAIQAAYDAAIVAGTGGNYEDGTVRRFSCQSCHMPPVTGQGCNKNPPVRADLPMHDQTGGNYWLADAIVWLDARGWLRLGGGLTSDERTALAAGQERARAQLAGAAKLAVSGNNVRVVNLTGHKLISGYPEGRRMWLNIRWYDASSQLVREDGAYGTITATVGDDTLEVTTLLDLSGAHTRIWEAKYGMTQEWASQLVALGYPADLPLGYDRVSGAPGSTLGQLAAQAAGTSRETFRFALNNTVVADDRIPPFGMSYEAARRRNTLPVPASRFGNPGPGGTYDYWDTVALEPPAGAVYATIRLLYQPTSWEYIQFLELANDGADVFLAEEGERLREAWVATGMAAPYVMAETTWGSVVDPTELFGDDFEGGDTCAWSARAGSGDGCGG